MSLKKSFAALIKMLPHQGSFDNCLIWILLPLDDLALGERLLEGRNASFRDAPSPKQSPKQTDLPTALDFYLLHLLERMQQGKTTVCEAPTIRQIDHLQ